MRKVENNCDRSSGRSRIGTCPPHHHHDKLPDCDRSSGRSRIGTKLIDVVVCRDRIAIVLRGDRGLEPLSRRSELIGRLIAIVLRGDRGLERVVADDDPVFVQHCDRSSGRSRIGTYHSPYHLKRQDCDRSSGRSRIGTVHQMRSNTRSLRSFFGAIEDWNISVCLLLQNTLRLRSFFGAIEDWNRIRRLLV